MALTEKQNRIVFHILEVPYSTEYHTVEAMGTLSAQTDINNVTGQAKTEILAYLAALSTDDQIDLVEYLERWDVIKLRTAKIEGGGLGDLSGVSSDPAQERALIKQYVQDMVPFYKHHEILARRTASNGITISIIH